MAVLVGIDEAGYGPILGPLVVSAATFEIPDESVGQPLWPLLNRSVSKKRLAGAGRIVVNDSKKLHHGKGQYHLLQRGVLAFLRAAEQNCPPPGVLGELLERLGARDKTDFLAYPWYGSSVDDWPLKYNLDDIATAACALFNDMNRCGIRLLELRAELLAEGQFNRMVEAVDNKASVLFTLTGRHICRAFQHYGRAPLQILIDKQGSRSHYRSNLQRIFPDLQMKILKEQDSVSSYHLVGQNRAMKIHFIERGDDRQLPVSLASMTSKYLRELFMEMLNAYFQKLCPGIPPTAGYYKDGRRFLADLQARRLPPHQTPADLLIRRR